MNKKMKIITLILSCVLLIGAAVGIAAGIIIENLNKKGVNETDETTDDYEEQETEHTMSM